MGGKEDRCGDNERQVVEAPSDDMRLFFRAYRVVRWAEVIAACAGIVMLPLLTIYAVDVLPIAVLAVGFIVCVSLDQAKVALKLAMDTEEERREEAENFRRLSTMVCLRDSRKGR